MKHVDLSTESGEAVPQFLMDRLDPFRTAFTEPTWRLARVLAMGALLALGKRTVSSCLRITGNVECKSFSSYHQVLNRAQWEPSDFSKILLHRAFCKTQANSSPDTASLYDDWILDSTLRDSFRSVAEFRHDSTKMPFKPSKRVQISTFQACLYSLHCAGCLMVV